MEPLRQTTGEAALRKEMLQHLLSRHKLGEYQNFQIRFALISLQTIEPVEKGTRLDIRPCLFAAGGGIEK